MLASCLLTIATLAWSTWSHIQLDAQQILRRQPGEITTRKNASAIISPALFADLEELSRVVDITYCVGSVAAGIQPPFECPSRCSDFPSFELITTFNTGITLSDSCGFIALSHPPAPKRIIVAFRGTYSISNTIADLSTIPQEYVPYPGADGDTPAVRGHGDIDHDGRGNNNPIGTPHPKTPKCENCTVHTGFYTSWLNTREIVIPPVLNAHQKHPDYAISVVGHSLGGAVAAFAGLELLARGLHPTLTTFGEPRIGNAATSKYIDEQFGLRGKGNDTDKDHSTFRRVTHVGDPVPLLPLDEWGYVPHGGEIFISKWDLPPENDDVKHCEGATDVRCSAAPQDGFWAIPARYKLWQLFFAHRDYFWRLGLCLPALNAWWPGADQDQQLEL